MKSINPVLSIIIPVYNVQNYLPQLIDSLSKQTVTNFETIFVDDGSTDMSHDILIDQMNLLRNHTTIIQQSNSGLSAARNTGIFEAMGEYIFFLDSDDEVVNSFVQTIIQTIADNNKPDTIMFDYMSIDDLGNHIVSDYGHGNIYRNKDMLSNSIVLNSLARDEIPTTAWSFVTKKKLIIDHNILFSVGKKFEDTNFTPKVIYYSKNIRLIPEKLYKYRQREGSIMAMHSEKDASDAIFVVNDLYQFSIENPLPSLNAVVGRASYTTLSRFLNSKEVYKTIGPIFTLVHLEFLEQNNSRSKIWKSWLFNYYIGYKIYSSIKKLL